MVVSSVSRPRARIPRSVLRSAVPPTPAPATRAPASSHACTTAVRPPLLLQPAASTAWELSSAPTSSTQPATSTPAPQRQTFCQYRERSQHAAQTRSRPSVAKLAALTEQDEWKALQDAQVSA